MCEATNKNAFRHIMGLTRFSDVFVPVRDEVHQGMHYKVLRSTYPRSTMVLYSKKTRTPLAALILTTPLDRGVMSLLTKRPPPAGDEAAANGAAYFQGMLNMPDQEFTFTMVNFSQDGYINFNILHTPHEVREVDPGPEWGINQVNEIYTGEAYTVDCDQRTNKTMVLQMLKTETGREVKVKETQSSDPLHLRGLTFHLSVVPAANAPLLVTYFREGTYWECSQYVICRSVVPLTKSRSRGLTCSTVETSSANRFFSSVDDNDDEDDNDEEKDSGEQDETSAIVEPMDIDSTVAGSLSYGRSVDVRVGFTGVGYRYDLASAPTTLCMSIYEGMKFRPLPDIATLAAQDIKDWVENQGKTLMMALPAIYKSDKCVVDLESEADVVIIQCGHECLNHKNTAGIIKCPLCRREIMCMVVNK